jgi:hypothetical protein
VHNAPPGVINLARVMLSVATAGQFPVATGSARLGYGWGVCQRALTGVALSLGPKGSVVVPV